MEIKYIFHINLHLKDRLHIEFTFHSLLRQADATGCADIIYYF